MDRKIAISAALTISLLTGVLALFYFMRPGGGPGEGGPGLEDIAGSGKRTGAPASDPQKASAGEKAAPGTGEKKDAAGEAAAAAAEAEDLGPVSLQGRITGGAGEGVAGAQVLAAEVNRLSDSLSAIDDMQTSFQGGDPIEAFRKVHETIRARTEAFPRVQSAEDGAYVFRGLPPGEYQVVVTHPGFLPRSDPWTVVPPDGPATLDIPLVPGRAIAGRVVDEAGQPIAGASVAGIPSSNGAVKGMAKMMQLFMDLADGKTILESGRVETGPDGAFTLGSLEPVLYDLSIHRDGFTGTRANRVPPGMKDLVLTLSRGGSIAGRVLDASRQPVAGARVTVQPPGKPLDQMNPMTMFQEEIDLLGEKIRRAATAEGGGFEISGLTAGKYRIEIQAEGSPLYSGTIDVAPRALDLGEIVLDPALAISGSVVDPRGAPIEGARVWVPRTPEAGTPTNPLVARGLAGREAIAETRSDSRGRFTLAGLRAGAYEVWAEADQFVEGSAKGVEAGSAGVSIPLTEGLSIRGKVIADASGEPVPGARIQLVLIGMKKEVTDAQGLFEFHGIPADGLARFGGSAYVLITHPEYGTTNANFQPQEDGSPAEIRLSKIGRLTGMVFDLGGKPVRNARIRMGIPGVPTALLALAPGSKMPAASSGADGSFSVALPGVNFGGGGEMAFEVSASHPVHGFAHVGPIKPPGRGEPWPQLELTLVPGSAIEGTVTDRSGQPVAGAQVRAARAGQAPPTEMRMLQELLPRPLGKTGYSAEDGRYRVADLEPGTYTVEAASIGYALRKVDPVEVGSEPARLDIALDAGGSISGRVVDIAGAPFPGAEAVAFIEIASDTGGTEIMNRMNRQMRLLGGVGTASARSGAGGQFEIANLPEGTYSVVIRSPGHEPAQVDGVHPGDLLGDMLLKRHAAIRGAVFSAGTRSPVAEFQVQVAKAQKEGEEQMFDIAARMPRQFNHPEGLFLFDGLSGGEHTVTVQATGYAPFRQEISIDDGEELALEVPLRPGMRISGIVLEEESGLPIAGVQVHHYQQSQDPFIRSLNNRANVTDANGAFIIEDLGEGKHQVMISHASYFSSNSSKEVQLPAELGMPLEFHMRHAGRMTGRIRNVPRDDWPRIQYQVTLRSFDARAQEGREKPAVNRPGPARPVEAVKRKGDEGSVASEQAVEQQVPTYQSSTFVDRDGNFTVDSLPPGSYQVAARRNVLNFTPGGSTPATQAEMPQEVILGEIEILAGESRTFDASLP